MTVRYGDEELLDVGLRTDHAGEGNAQNRTSACNTINLTGKEREAHEGFLENHVFSKILRSDCERVRDINSGNARHGTSQARDRGSDLLAQKSLP